MIQRLHSVLVGLVLVSTSACSLNLESNYETPRFYVIRDIHKSDAETKTSCNLRLEVTNAQSSRLIDSRKIIFSDNASTRQYYKFALWGETPPKRVTTLLMDRLRNAEIFRSVTSQSSATVADVQLSLELSDFYHDITERPGKARIELWAELLDLRTREVIATRRFQESSQADSYDVEGAVAGFERGIDKLYDDLLKWVEESIVVSGIAQKGQLANTVTVAN